MTHEFVDLIPKSLKDDTLYISIKYGSIIHKCCCGCGNEVVTPISPTDWEFVYNGETISLYPSIGNWNFNCQSHYWIRNNQIIWAPKWSRKEIEKNRKYDFLQKGRYYSGKNVELESIEHRNKLRIGNNMLRRILYWFNK